MRRCFERGHNAQFLCMGTDKLNLLAILQASFAQDLELRASTTMQLLNPAFPTGSNASRLAFAKRSYLARNVGLSLGFIMAAAVLYQNQVPYWFWLGPVFHCFVFPHLGWWWARRSSNPRSVERRNLLADQFFSGAWMAAMSFSLLPCVLAVTLTGMDTMAGGGARLLIKGFAVQAVGVVVGVVVFGLNFVPEATLWTIIACLPVLVFQPFMVSYVALKAVSQLRAKGVELERLSQQDGLSGLFNRSHWEQLVRAEFARFGRNQSPVVLVLADLDHFKQLNDTYGHAAGDEAIRSFAAALKRVLRETDICGRYGGEEFGILLPITGAAAAHEVIERLRQDLHTHPLIAQTVITASFGLVEIDPGVASIEEWIRKADVLLYAAKRQGRDQVVSQDPDATVVSPLCAREPVLAAKPGAVFGAVSPPVGE